VSFLNCAVFLDDLPEQDVFVLTNVSRYQLAPANGAEKLGDRICGQNSSGKKGKKFHL
jgi:hypothetical protein